MLADPALAQAPARRVPLGPGDHLRAALLALASGHGDVVRHDHKRWASVTFEGARHTLVLRFEGVAGIAAGEDLIAALPDHEFAVPRQIVAEATVTAVDHQLKPEPAMTVNCELMLLDDT
jgi:hypothetical protein